MQTEPLVSVVVPTYNRAKIIAATIDNIFSQTYKNIELTVVDDGSTDDTQNVLSGYGKRIQVIRQENAGPAIARNRGVKASNGEIIAFQDSDDLWRPDKLARQVALLGRAGDSVPCCLSNAVFSGSQTPPRTSFGVARMDFQHHEGLWLNAAEVLATRFVLFNQTVAIRRWAIERVGGFDEKLKYLEDYDLPLRLALLGDWSFIRDPLVIYREGSPNSFSERAAEDRILLKKCEVAIFERALADAKERGHTSARQLSSRLNMFRGLLFSTTLRCSEHRITRAAGAVLRNAQDTRERIFRRSPGYPKPLTLPM